MTLPSRAGSLALIALLFGVLWGCDDSLRNTQFPDLEASPDSIVLTPVPVGESTTGRVTLRNKGGARLQITAISFSNRTNELEFEKNHPALPIILEADEEAALTVTFTPRDSVLGSGDVLITSNDRETPELRIPIRTTNAASGLLIQPTALELVAEQIGSTVEGKITVSNTGLLPVNVLDVYLSEETPNAFETTDDIAARPMLQRDDTVEFTVRYTAEDAVPDRGQLIILTDDPTTPRVAVELLGRLPRPAIFVEPGAVNFGAVDLGGETEIIELVVENRGSAPLILENISLAFVAPPTNDQYTLHDLPEFPLTIAEDSAEFVRFGINYHPVEDGRHRTAISFQSNDPVNAVFTVPVDGRVRKPCISVRPVQVDFGRVALGQTSAHNQLQVANCGDLPLQISDLVIDNPDFDWALAAGGQMAQMEIAPLSAVDLEVWYTNNGLAQGEVAEATLTLSNNTPDTPELAVPLTVVGGGAPTCDLIILPARADFGLVSRGSNRTKELKVVNRGTGECHILTETVAPVFPIPGVPEVFFLTQPVGARRAAPGEFLPFEVTYAPQFFSADAATYTVTYRDPFAVNGMPAERTATASLQGIAGESNIEVIPSRLDFGGVTAGECASRDERVTVYNTGIVDLCIRDIRFEGDCDEFFLVERPIANMDGCIIVSRNTPADFQFVYEPGDLGADECEVVFISDAADSPEMSVPLLGEGVADSRQTDVFEQTSGRTVDILFVIDNSGSMSEEQDNLRDNFADFVTGAQQFQNDFQLGIVTTDMDAEAHQGRMVDPRVMARGPDVARIFEDAVRVGSNGAGEEKGLEAAQRALSDPLIFDTGVACVADGDCMAPDACVTGFCGGHNRGFLRDEAALEVIFVSDEDDFSTGTLNFYVDFFKNLKGFRNEGLFHANAIVGANNGRAASCNSADGDASPGRRYVEVADRTNGRVFSICDADYGASLQDLGNQAFGLPVQFFLTRPAVPESVEVAVEAVPRNDGWAYDGPSNSVIFDDDQVPQPMDTITVNYNAQCFPRRN
jgi:hypothetical protein